MGWSRNSRHAVAIDHDVPSETVKKIRRLRLVDSSFEDPVLLSNRLFSALSEKEPLLQLSMVNVVLVGFNENDSGSLQQTLIASGVKSCNRVADLQDEQVTRRTVTHLIVNVDALGDLTDVVDALLSFRKRNANCAVVLTSSKIIADDLGTERRAICDVSLRLPLSQSRLIKGIFVASTNNREFRLP